MGVSESEKKAKPQVKNNNSKNGVKNGKHEKLDDAAVEKEFLSFIAKMRSKYPGNGLAYQMNNYPERLRERRREAKLRRKAEKENENPEKATENGDVKKAAVKEEKKAPAKEEMKEEKVIPKEVKKVEKAVTKETSQSEKVIA